MSSMRRGVTKTRDIRVNKLELLEKITNNRNKHLEAYQEMVAGYRRKLLKMIDDKINALAQLQSHISEDTGFDKFVEPISFNLPVPHSYVKDYDQAIAMLQMEVDSVVSIGSEEFRCLVLDDWDWKEDFDMVSGMYR